MRYRKPFTLDQRQAAIELYRSWRQQIARIRHEFRPRNDIERRAAKAFRDAANDFAHALQMKDAKVDVDRLSALGNRAIDLGTHYAIIRNRRPDL